MWCGQCDHDLVECQCPDLQQRMRKLTDGVVCVKWCRVCDQSYHSCRCPSPDFYVRGPHGRTDIPLPPQSGSERTES